MKECRKNKEDKKRNTKKVEYVERGMLSPRIFFKSEKV